MPRYAALIYEPAEEATQGTEEDWAKMMVEYTAFGEKAGAAGVDVVTADGPFAETKEVLGGFYLLDCKDLDEPIKWAAQIPGAWHGRVEVRPCIDFEAEG